MNFTKKISAALKIPSWRLFYIRTEDSEVQDCVTVKFGIIGNGKFSCKAFNEYTFQSASEFSSESVRSSNSLCSTAYTFHVTFSTNSIASGPYF